MGQPAEFPGVSVAPWGFFRKVLFRFVFAYLVLYILPFPLQYIPGTQSAWRTSQDIWNAAVPWIGERVFGLGIVVFPNGSGDTTYNYVQVFCYLVLAAGMALAWSLVDWRKTNYAHLREWLRVYVRFYLASMMISYGAVKVIKSQFPDPSLDRLIEPFGDASPMGLLWTFMGASVSYNVFAGAGEILGGLLLTTRRTTTFGALIGIGVLGNVAMLNFSYDVPVKLFSLHLLAMAAFLLIPDLRRLAKFLVFNRPVNPTDLRPLFPWRWVDWTAAVLRTTIVVAFTGLMFANAYRSQGIFGDRAPKSPLRGVWNVDEFQIDGKTRPPLLTDADRWRRVVFDYPSMVSIQLMSNSRVRHALFLDPDQRTLALMNREHPSWNTKLRYELPEPDHLVIQGNYGGHPMRADLRRTSDSDFLLVNRGFHWINEYPFNR